MRNYKINTKLNSIATTLQSLGEQMAIEKKLNKENIKYKKIMTEEPVEGTYEEDFYVFYIIKED